MSRIGIIIGTTRDNSAGKVVGEWLYDLAHGRQDGVEYTLLDLKEFDVPLLTTDVIPATANKQYADEKVQAWSDAVDACDGFVFVTPESTAPCQVHSRMPSTAWPGSGPVSQSRSPVTVQQAQSAAWKHGAPSWSTSPCHSCAISSTSVSLLTGPTANSAL